MSDDLLSVEQFCRTSVEPMGEESDHVHIVALADALQVPIRVVYLDRSMGGDDGAAPNMHDFAPSTQGGWGDAGKEGEQGEEEGGGATVPAVHILYRPGHYDILYPR